MTISKAGVAALLILVTAMPGQGQETLASVGDEVIKPKPKLKQKNQRTANTEYTINSISKIIKQGAVRRILVETTSTNWTVITPIGKDKWHLLLLPATVGLKIKDKKFKGKKK